MVNPLTLDKYRYIEHTPTWKVRSLYAFGIFSWLFIIYGFAGLWGVDPFFTWFVIPVVAFLTVYHLSSFVLNLFYRQHDLPRHHKMVSAFVASRHRPSVDIYLPICGEDLSVLDNTWKHVSRIDYPNKKVYVLDDSAADTEAHEALAQRYGFTYFLRPNRGEMKKAGNLKYAYERTGGDFIVIFDADFAPHPDFLKETLPYMSDPKIGIVQTPQYFELTQRSYKESHVAYNAAFAEEPFYRFIQVTRSRFGGTICCGSNAVYRRAALDAIGGPYQIDYSEDAHTGFAMTCKGYRVQFVPILLAIGLCPDNQYAFFHQQHRWCMGSMRLMLSRNFWHAPISWKTKACYITGFMFYFHHPVIIIFSFQLFWTLFLYNEYIPLGVSWIFLPHIIFALIYVFTFPVARTKLGYFLTLIARTYAYAHAVKTALLGKSVRWVSTNARHSTVSAAFRQTRGWVRTYVVLYVLLIALGLRSGDIHLLNGDYWSVQFWILWNFTLSAILLWQMSATIRKMERPAPIATPPTALAPTSPTHILDLRS